MPPITDDLDFAMDAALEGLGVTVTLGQTARGTLSPASGSPNLSTSATASVRAVRQAESNEPGRGSIGLQTRRYTLRTADLTWNVRAGDTLTDAALFGGAAQTVVMVEAAAAGRKIVVTTQTRNAT